VLEHDNAEYRGRDNIFLMVLTDRCHVRTCRRLGFVGLMSGWRVQTEGAYKN
jgi:hypothetical protein